MLQKLKQHARIFKGTILHPQWLGDRNHANIQSQVNKINNSHILNIGSGNSEFTKQFEEENELIQYDFPTTNQLYNRKPHVYGNASNLPFEQSVFDIIFLFEVLEHISNDLDVIRETFRTLKPKGRLFLSTPFLYPVHDAPYDYHRYTVYALQHLLADAGFCEIQIKSQGNAATTSLLLFNLALLNLLKKLERINTFLLLAGIPIAYIISLFINLIGALFILLPADENMCIGYFLSARKP